METTNPSAEIRRGEWIAGAKSMNKSTSVGTGLLIPIRRPQVYNQLLDSG